MLNKEQCSNNIFNKCGNIYFFTLQKFGPSPSLNFKSTEESPDQTNNDLN